MDDIRAAYEKSVCEQLGEHIHFEMAMQVLQKLALVRLYEAKKKGRLLWKRVTIHRIVQKLVVQDDVEGMGLKNLLMSEYYFLLLD